MCAQILDNMSHNFEKDYLSSGNTSEFCFDGKVLDLGCGSGILSIIAARLGMSNIDAVDIDEVAVSVARDNVKKNQAENRINCFTGQAADLKSDSYTIVVANIIADVLIDICEEVRRLIKKQGYFIASGVINTKKDRVVEKYLSAGFYLVDTKEQDDWIALVFSNM